MGARRAERLVGGAKIRRCGERDATLVADLARRTFAEAYGADTPAEQMQRHLSRAFEVESIRGELLSPDSTFFLAAVEGTPAGYLKVNAGEAQSDFAVPGALEIESLYVLEEFQGQGVGRLLFEQALREAAILNAEHLWLGVWERNPRGKAFWERMGFAEAGTHPFDFGGAEHTDLVMRRELPRS